MVSPQSPTPRRHAGHRDERRDDIGDGAVEILPPDESWAGLTRGELDARFWQWNMSMPEDVNPYFDDDRCNAADTDSPGLSSSCRGRFRERRSHVWSPRARRSM